MVIYCRYIMTVKNIFNRAQEFTEQPLFFLRSQLHRHLEDGDVCGGLPAHEQVGGGEIVIFWSKFTALVWLGV